jgi:nucleotide-binding universal stress UspA family protein
VAEIAPAPGKEAEMETIVVGVDGSACARAALRFAVHEARIRGARIRAVSVWHVPLGAYGAGWVPTPESLVEDCEQAARDVLEQALADAGNVEGIEIDPVVREGNPARVLVEEARAAALLVVGSRGLGGFRELLLGSVSQQCAHHARCPVVIVRHQPDGGGDGCS